MVDNIKVNPSLNANALNVATDEISDRHHPLYKLEFGEDGDAILVSANNRLPVEVSNLPLEDNATLLLNEISNKLSILIEYQTMLHGVKL